MNKSEIYWNPLAVIIHILELSIRSKKMRLFCIYKDVEGRFAFAYAYRRLSSKTSMDFMKKLKEVIPFLITHIQTDNGSEFHGLLWTYTCTALCQ